MPGKKLTALTQATTLNNTDLIYVVKPDETAGSKSQGIEKSDFETSFSPGGSTTNRVVQGGIVWIGTGLVYESLNLIYEINGQQFAIADGTQVTLAAADGTHPRLDNLYGDDTGSIGKITGTPAATPVLTSVDETSQISITFALVAASAITPSDVDIRDVYLENAQEVGGEWDTAESTSGVRIDLANTTNPLTSTKDIKTLSALTNADTITFNHTTATTIANFNYLQFSIKLLTAWANDYLIIQLKNGATVISTCVVDGSKLDITDITNTQTISLFKAEFTAASDTEFDTITVYNRVKGASTLQYQMDDITVYEDAGATDPVQILASDVSVDTTNFATNLTSADDTVQKALDTLDDLVAGGGGGSLVYQTEITTNTTLTTQEGLNNVYPVNSASAVTITVPSGVYSENDVINFERQGLGSVEIVAGTGVRIRGVRDSDNKYFINDTSSMVSLLCRGSEEFTIIGNLSRGYTSLSTTSYDSLYNGDVNAPITVRGTGFSSNMIDPVLTGNATLVSWAFVSSTEITLNITETGAVNDLITVTYDNGEVLTDTDAIKIETPIPTANLVRYFRFNGDATDETATANGTETSMNYVAGKSDQAADFNGTSSKVTLADAADLSFGDGTNDSEFSISAWVKLDAYDTTLSTIIMKRDGSTNDEWQLDVDPSGNVRFILFDESAGANIRAVSTTVLSLDTWYHVVVTYDATEADTGIEIYINGVIESTPTRSTSGTYTAMESLANDALIGMRSWGGDDYQWNGQLDGLGIWADNLTTDEVSSIYVQQNQGNEIL